MHRYKYLNLSTVGQQRYQRNSVAMQWCCHWGDPCFSSTTERSCSRPVHGTDITWPKNRRHLMLLKRTFKLFLSRLFNYPLLQLLNNFPWTCMWSASCLSKNKVSWQKKNVSWLLLPDISEVSNNVAQRFYSQYSTSKTSQSIITECKRVWLAL